MESMGINAPIKPFDFTRLGPFNEEEMSAMLSATLKKLDVNIRTSGPAPRRPLVDFFGIQKSMKTATTVEIEKVLRRNKFKTYCPPESAEHEDIRADVVDDPIVFQAKHLNVVMDQALTLSKSRDYHFSIVSRNLPDMLYWYEKGRRKGIYSEVHAQSAKNWIYELLRQDLLDLSIFFSCSPEAAIKREYSQSPTQKRGSKMNEKDIAEGLGIYETVKRELTENVPNLPVFNIDTSEMTVKQAAEEALRFILPTICIRYDVPEYTFMPYALSLVQKRAEHSAHFEEQLKLSGHSRKEKIQKAGWIPVKENTQKDIYLKSNPALLSINPWGEVIRLRYEDGLVKFMYKGSSQDQILSHRYPHSFLVEEAEAKKILESYQIATILNKRRLNFRKEGLDGDGHFFTLHVDYVEGLGNFTEIRARGNQDRNHTQELLTLAGELGFKTSSIVNGNYLSLAINS